MSEHEWKIGDWCELNARRGLVFNMRCDRPVLVLQDGGYVRANESHQLKHLPDCTGWDWQPPKPIEPGEGWRLINNEKDEPQEGDEYWSMHNGRWADRPYDLRFSKEHTYRRKLPPKYRPFADAREFAGHRHRWITRLLCNGQPATDGAWRVLGYDDRGVWSDCALITYQDLLGQYQFTVEVDGVDVLSKCGVVDATSTGGAAK
jgi:hypothetical protein